MVAQNFPDFSSIVQFFFLNNKIAVDSIRGEQEIQKINIGGAMSS